MEQDASQFAIINVTHVHIAIQIAPLALYIGPLIVRINV